MVEVDQIQAARSIRDTLNDIYEGESEFRLGTDLLVLRLPVNTPWHDTWFDGTLRAEAPAGLAELLGSADPSVAFQRALDRPVHLLGCRKGEIILSPNLNPQYTGDLLGALRISHSDAISQIRDAELDCILERSRALLTSAENTVFRAPSGKLVRNFIRVGNIQYDRDAIDAVCFWLLPHLRRAAAILTDTWSISSIALNAARIAGTHFGAPAPPVEFLPDYLGTAAGSEERAVQIVERLVREAQVANDRNKVLCLVSATQSGSLRDRLQKVAREPLGQLYPHFVAIFGLGKTEMHVLRDLSGDDRFALLDDNHPQGAGGRPVPIDPKVYFPLEFHDYEYALNKGEAEASRETLDAMARHGIVQVHRNVTKLGRTRHHAIHLDTELLAELGDFKKRIAGAAVVVEKKPIAVVFPPTLGSEKVATEVNESLAARGLGTVTFAHPNLFFDDKRPMTDEERTMRARIRGATVADAIVVVVDAWINDASLAQYQRFLRTEGFRGRIHYIVGVARPADPTAWTRSASRLRHRDPKPFHTVTIAYDLPLPDWEEPDCPWCAELRLYVEWAAVADLPPLLLARRDRLLAARPTGMVEDIALELPGRKMRLGPESFYVKQDSSPADAFAGVASALQRLRSGLDDRPRLGPRRFPTATVLKHEDYLRETWTDSLLRAMFLRAASADELTFTGAGRESARSRELRMLATDPSPGLHEVILELLLAVALGKAALEVDDDLRDSLRVIGEQATISYMLDRIAESRAGPATANGAAPKHPEGQVERRE